VEAIIPLRVDILEEAPWAMAEGFSGRIHHALEVAMGFVKPCPNPLEVTVILSEDAKVRDLNHRYRNQDAATNVLSFPQQNFHQGDCSMGQEPHEMPLLLGDIFLARETIQREAVAQGKSLEDHTLHLALHGFLHVLGFDHIEDTEAQDMEQLEVLILERLGIQNPYESTEERY